jgi:hypothetical protein
MGGESRASLHDTLWQWREMGARGGDGDRVRGQVNHTNTTRSYVSSNHDGALAGLEFVENPIALVLLLVAVDGCRNVSGLDAW